VNHDLSVHVYYLYTFLTTEGRITAEVEVKEAVLVLFELIELADAHTIRDHGLLIDQEEECLIRMQLQSTSNDLHQLGDGDVIGYEEFASIQQREIFLPFESFNDHRHLVRLMSLVVPILLQTTFNIRF